MRRLSPLENLSKSAKSADVPLLRSDTESKMGLDNFQHYLERVQNNVKCFTIFCTEISDLPFLVNN